MSRFIVGEGMRVTIKDVAKQAGVSVGTVSAVLNGKGRVSAPLRTRVTEAIRQLDYQPSHYARSLATQRTSTLAYVVPSVSNPVFSRILHCVSDIARERGYVVVVLNTQGDSQAAAEAVRHLVGLRVDGVVMALTWELVQPDLLALLARRSIPVVGLSGSRLAAGIDCFMWQESEAAAQLTRYLLRLGHRQIAYCAPAASESARQRQDGIARALAQAGASLSTDLVLCGQGYAPRSAYEVVRNAIAAATPFSALVTFNHAYTVGAMAALADQGLQVPEHVSLATFGCEEAEFARPRITSMVFGEAQLAGKAMRRLLARIAGTYNEPARAEYLDLELSVQQSCRAVSAIV